MDMYVVTRQTTTNGTATNVVKVTGRDLEEATLNAKIKAYKTMEAFKNEATMIDAYVEVTDLVSGLSIIHEHWVKEVTE